MGLSSGPDLIPELSERPTSVFLHGSSRPLLNWVMYALLVRADPEFRWTDVRLTEEVLDPLDPLSRSVVPDERLSIIEPDVLQRTAVPHATVATMIRSDEPAESIGRTLDFLRLPGHTQELISRTPIGPRPAQLGLSNAHRLAALFPTATIRPTLRGILDSGVTLVMTWADAPPAGRRAYDFVIGVEGAGPKAWKDARLRCEIGGSSGRMRAGAQARLSELAPIHDVLEPMRPDRA